MNKQKTEAINSSTKALNFALFYDKEKNKYSIEFDEVRYLYNEKNIVRCLNCLTLKQKEMLINTFELFVNKGCHVAYLMGYIDAIREINRD